MLVLWLLWLLRVMTSFVSELCVSGLLPHAWNCSATCSLASSVKSQALYSLNNLYPHWEDGHASQKTFERRQCLSHVLQEVMKIKGLLVGEWQVNSRNRRMHAAAWSGQALGLKVTLSPVSSPLGDKLIFRQVLFYLFLFGNCNTVCVFLLCQMGHPWAEKTTQCNFFCLQHFWLPGLWESGLLKLNIQVQKELVESGTGCIFQSPWSLHTRCLPAIGLRFMFFVTNFTLNICCNKTSWSLTDVTLDGNIYT